MIKPETKPYENIASDIFTLAVNKFKYYEAVAGEIGCTSHYVSDVAKGKYQPTVPLLFACLNLVAPWFVEELRDFIRREVEKILGQRPATAVVREETRGASVRCLRGSPEGARA